jgi:hypothetical protein
MVVCVLWVIRVLVVAKCFMLKRLVAHSLQQVRRVTPPVVTSKLHHLITHLERTGQLVLTFAMPLEAPRALAVANQTVFILVPPMHKPQAALQQQVLAWVWQTPTKFMLA